MTKRVVRVEHVDGLRACAVIGVLLCHAAFLMPAWATIANSSNGVPLYWLGHVLADGAHGVDLFFVLSGLCLSYPTLKRLRQTGMLRFDLVRFATHRIVRIVPPYILSIVAFAAFALVLMQHSGSFAFPETGSVTIVDVARQLLFLDRGTVMVNSNYWTLAVEFRWYFAFPVCLAFLVWAPRFYLVTIVAAVVLYSQSRLYNIDLGVLPAFMLGIVAADVQVREHPIQRYAPLLAFASVIVAFATEQYSTMPGPTGEVYRSFYLQSNFGWQLAAFFFVVAAGRDGWLKRALSHPALVAIGVASYSIYLMHAPLMFEGSRMVSHLAPAAQYVALVLVGLMAGFGFWLVVERFFSTGNARDRLHEILAPRIAWLFSQVGAPDRLTLTSYTAKLEAPHDPGRDAEPLHSSARPSVVQL